MNQYEDCQRCGSVDGQRVFSNDSLDPWAFLCEECYELCKHFHSQSKNPEWYETEEGKRQLL